MASDYAKSHHAKCSVGTANIHDLSMDGSFTIQGIDIRNHEPTSWLTRSAKPLAPHAISFDVRDNPCVVLVPYFSVQ
eukprot:SAG11_NODE_8098_length_1060_cov_1.709677_1_plen_76_part_10